MQILKSILRGTGLALMPSAGANAAPVTYEIDPSDTYPSFEADQMSGLSTWRGKFNRASGTIVLDRETKASTIAVTVQIDSVDFGHDEMNKHAVVLDIFNAAKHPSATFKGKFTEFDGERPTAAEGELTLRGATRKIEIDVEKFKCIDHPMKKREACGADVSASLKRSDCGLDFALNKEFKPEVELKIQVGALRK